MVDQQCAARVLEFGAGSGRLCVRYCRRCLTWESYQMLDLSAELKNRQQYYLRNLLDSVQLRKNRMAGRLTRVLRRHRRRQRGAGRDAGAP